MFEKNSNLVSMYIKLIAQMTDCSNQQEVVTLAKIFRKHSYADQLEQVRVSNVKSLSKVLQKLDLK